jgi:hypothetical protein
LKILIDRSSHNYAGNWDSKYYLEDLFTMNFKPFLLLVALFTVASAIVVIKPFQPSQTFKSPHASKYYEKYNKIHADTLNRIKKAFNITNADWRSHMNYAADVIKKDTLFAAHPFDRSSIAFNDHYLVKEAKEILIKCGIDPKNVTIKLDRDPLIKAAAEQRLLESNTIKHSLVINPDWLSKLSPQERESVLRHEIMHLTFYDSIEYGFIIGLLEQKGYTRNAMQKNPAIMNYLFQLETRADILSVLDKPSLAKVCQDRYARLAQKTKSFPANSWTTHPSDQTRAQNFAQLLADISQPQLA